MTKETIEQENLKSKPAENAKLKPNEIIVYRRLIEEGHYNIRKTPKLLPDFICCDSKHRWEVKSLKNESYTKYQNRGRIFISTDVIVLVHNGEISKLDSWADRDKDINFTPSKANNYKNRDNIKKTIAKTKKASVFFSNVITSAIKQQRYSKSTALQIPRNAKMERTRSEMLFKKAIEETEAKNIPPPKIPKLEILKE